MAPSKREVFENTYKGAQPPPLLPATKSDIDQPLPAPLPATLEAFRKREAAWEREARLRTLWKTLSDEQPDDAASGSNTLSPDAERARKLKQIYRNELMKRVATGKGEAPKTIQWREFLAYADQKELELWDVFHKELDLDGNGRLDAHELRSALAKAGQYLIIIRYPSWCPC